MKYTPDETELIKRELAVFWTNYKGILNDALHVAEERAKEMGDETPPWHKVSMRDGVLAIVRMKVERLQDCTADKVVQEVTDIINYVAYLAAYTLMCNGFHPEVPKPVTSSLSPAAQALAAREVKK